MIIKDLAVALSGLIGLGIIAIGVRFLLAPPTAAAGYGVAITEEIGEAGAYLSAKRARHRLRPGSVPADRHRGT